MQSSNELKWVGTPDQNLLLKKILKSSQKSAKHNTNVESKAVKGRTLAITELHKVGLNSLFLKWEPTDINSVIGYSVFINGKPKTRIFNRHTNMTVLDYLPLNSFFVVTVKEIGCEGREKKHGASTVYKILY